MKRCYFIKYNERIKRTIGCDRATLIFDRLEFYSSRQPKGFYKFIEPNSHKLYKKEESWVELMDCHRTSFWRSFKLIGEKHISRRTFEMSEDKFKGKLYASYYDRYTNQTFFIRNHQAVKEFLKEIHPEPEPVLASKERKGGRSFLAFPLKNSSLSTEQIARSYIETKNTSDDLSKDKSHADNEIVASMIEIWKTRVDAKTPVEMTSRLIAFLKQAFKDKFNSCLEKWRAYCERIASSKFLMGESKSSFKATLDWILKFDVIQKILAGNYGIGDRTPPASVVTMKEVKASIRGERVQDIKDFQETFLNIAGARPYRSVFSNLKLELAEDKTLKLITRSAWEADYLERNHYSTLKMVLEKSENIQTLVILAVGETEQKGRKIQGRREGVTHLYPVVPIATDTLEILEEDLPFYAKKEIGGECTDLVENLKSVPASKASASYLTQKLRDKISAHHKVDPLPNWLLQLEVEDITREGKVIVCLEDEFTVGYCRSRYSGFILEECRKLWPQVNQVDIQYKGAVEQPVIKPCPQTPHGKQELKCIPGSVLEEAIESLKAAFAAGQSFKACPDIGETSLILAKGGILKL